MPLSDMPDEAFASGMLGVGYAIEPSKGCFYAPAGGRIESVADAYHAYTIVTDDGLDILVHIGVDTVRLNGEGFAPHVREGQRVGVGDLIAEAELANIRTHGLPTVTAVLVTNSERIERAEFRYGTVKARDAVMYFRLCGRR